MPRIECDRERDALNAIRAGRWDDELREHVATCATCADLVDVAGALLEDRVATMRDVHLPASGLVWWRMQMRMRQQAVHTASRTMTMVQAAVLGFAAIVAFLLLRGSGWSASIPPDILAQWTVPLLVALAAWLALAPVAVYLAVTED